MLRTIATLKSDSHNLTTFVERNSSRYNIIPVAIDELTRHQVMVFSRGVSASVLTRRLLWEERTCAFRQANFIGSIAHDDCGHVLPTYTERTSKFHKADKQSYIVDYDHGGNIAVTRLTWDVIVGRQSDERQVDYWILRNDVESTNEDELHIWVHQLYTYMPQLKAIKKGADLKEVCDAITSFYGYDVDAYSYIVDDKMSVFTCTDDRNEFLNKGESTSHTEDRGRVTLNYNSLLASVKNAVQSLAYAALGITEEHDVRARQNSDTIAYWQDIDDACGTDYADHCAEHELLDINPAWLNSYI